MSGLLAAMVLSVRMGTSHRMVTLSFLVLEMGQFFILRPRVQQEYNGLLVNALNRVFQSNLSLNTFKWLLTKVESFRAFEILYPVLENASEMDTPF